MSHPCARNPIKSNNTVDWSYGSRHLYRSRLCPQYGAMRNEWSKRSQSGLDGLLSAASADAANQERAIKVASASRLALRRKFFGYLVMSPDGDPAGGPD